MDTKPFLGIKDTCKVTGLSQKYLRAGCNSGEIPHIKVGNRFMINVPMLLKTLDEKSRVDNLPTVP